MKKMAKKVESWKPVVGYEEAYEVSSSGLVRSKTRTGVSSLGYRYPVIGRLLKRTLNRRGYYRVSLWYEGKGRTKEVHRLVSEAFLGPCPKGRQVRHLDGSRINNQVTNLKYGTPKQNQTDRQLHGTKLTGERHQNSKLTDQDREEMVYEYWFKGCTMRQLARRWGVSPATVSRSVNA